MDKFLPSFLANKVQGFREGSAPASLATDALDQHDGPPSIPKHKHKPGGPEAIMRSHADSRYYVELEPGEDTEYAELQSLPNMSHRNEKNTPPGDVAHVEKVTNFGGSGTTVDAQRASAEALHGPENSDYLTDDEMISDEEDKEIGDASEESKENVGKIVSKLEKAISEGDMDSGIEMLRILAESRAEVRLHVLSANRQRRAPDPPFFITVVVETARTGTGPTWRMQVKGSMTIFALKMKVALLYGIPISQQSWIIGRAVPANTDIFGECGVEADATVFLYINKQDLEDSREEKTTIERFHRDILLRRDEKDMELCFTSDEYQKYLKEIKSQQNERNLRRNQTEPRGHSPHDVPRQENPPPRPQIMAPYPETSVRGYHRSADHGGGMYHRNGGTDHRNPNTFAGYGRTPRDYQHSDMPARGQPMSPRGPPMPPGGSPMQHVYMEYPGGNHEYNDHQQRQYHDVDDRPRPYHPDRIPPQEAMDPLDGPFGDRRDRRAMPNSPQNFSPKMAAPWRPMDFAPQDRQPQPPVVPTRAMSTDDLRGRLMSYDGSQLPMMGPASLMGEHRRADGVIDDSFNPFRRGGSMKKATKKRRPKDNGFAFHDEHFRQEPMSLGPMDHDAFGYGPVPDSSRNRMRNHVPHFIHEGPGPRRRKEARPIRAPSQGKPTATDVGWKCPACTLVNPPSYPSCKVCLQDRPGNYRVPPRGSYIMDREEARMVAEKEASEVQFAEMQVIEKEKEDQEARKTRRELFEATEVNVRVNNEEFECPICFSEIPPGEGIRLQECLHEICRDCCTDYINKSDDAQIKCPFTDGDGDCQQTILDREIREIVGNGNYDAFAKRSLKRAEATSANTFHCLTPNCEGFCFYDDDHNFFNCPICKQNNCLTCNVVHDGMNCKEYQDDIRLRAVNDLNARATQEQLERLMREGQAQKCPQCGVVIQKKGGCPNMTCSVCHRGFRWTGVDM